jgi:fibro-slime domain-containing protein
MGATGYNADSAAVEQGWRHDSWFTTEARYLFNFSGAFSLDFYGDDDTFVFINGTLVIDLGGVHQRIPGHVDVDAIGNAPYTWGGAIDPTTNQIACATAALPLPGSTRIPSDADAEGLPHRFVLGLQMGKTEIAIFGADRGARSRTPAHRQRLLDE